MRKILYIMTLTALAFPFASQAGVKKLCFESSSSVSGDKSTQNYTYGEIRNGHVNLFGRVCYTPKIGVTECSPAMGSSILHNNVLEGNIQYAEFENYSGVENFTEQTIHVKLNLDTLLIRVWLLLSHARQPPRSRGRSTISLGIPSKSSTT
jgi:hypothetical protein